MNCQPYFLFFLLLLGLADNSDVMPNDADSLSTLIKSYRDDGDNRCKRISAMKHRNFAFGGIQTQDLEISSGD